MTSTSIRAARDSDIDGIVALCKSSLAATYGSFLDEEKMRPWIEGDEAEKYVRKTLSRAIVAEESGSIVGIASLEDDMIGLLWVAIERRGRGIGGRLLAEAERMLAAGGQALGKLECFEDNVDSIAFYESKGWRAVSTSMHETAGVNQVLMHKDIGTA